MKSGETPQIEKIVETVVEVLKEVGLEEVTEQKIRTMAADRLGMMDPNELSYKWIVKRCVETYMLSLDEEDKDQVEEEQPQGLEQQDVTSKEIKRGNSPNAENKSKENALLVQQLQNQYEETITILKEALTREEEELVKEKDGATKRIEEIENVLNERDDTNMMVLHLQKENERLDSELSFMQGCDRKRTIEKDLFVEKLQKKCQACEEKLQHLQTENEKLQSEISYLKSQEGTTNMLMRMGETQVEKENLMIQHEETVAKLKAALEREKVILGDNNGAAKKIEELSLELSRLKSYIEASLQSTEKLEKERDKAHLQLKRVQKENDDNMVQIKHLHTGVDEDLLQANQRIQNLLKEREQDRLKIEKLEKENDEKDEVIEKLKTSARQSEEFVKEQALKSAIKEQMHEEENTRLGEQVELFAERNIDLETEMVVHEERQKARQKNSTQEKTQSIQNSLYEHLKTRKRKQVQLDDYEYPNIAKRQRQKAKGI